MLDLVYVKVMNMLLLSYGQKSSDNQIMANFMAKLVQNYNQVMTKLGRK